MKQESSSEKCFTLKNLFSFLLWNTRIRNLNKRIIVPVFPKELDISKEEIHLEVVEIIEMNDKRTVHLITRYLE